MKRRANQGLTGQGADRNVGQHIREARMQARLTQRALARKLGTSYQLVQQYEHGRKPSRDRLVTLAALLKTNVDSLLDPVRGA